MPIIENFKMTIIKERLILIKQDYKWFFVNHELNKELEVKNSELVEKLEGVKRDFELWKHNKEELKEYLLVCCLNILEGRN